MTVYLVGAGPGDPGLLTRRGAKLLARADVVLYDRLVSPALLDLARGDAQLIDVGKRPDSGPAAGDGAEGRRGQDERQEDILRLLVAHGRRPGVVVRLKGGDPFLFGRGGEEVEVLAAAGIPFEVVPGVTSAFAAPAVAGIPVTHRGVASSVTVVTGRIGGSDGGGGSGGPDWEALARAGGTLVILMGMSTRAAIAEALVAGGRSPDTPAAVIARATTAAQRVAHTTLAGLASVDLDSPAVIVVGPVVSLAHDSPSVTSGALSGRTVVVTRSSPRARGLVDALERAGAVTVELPLTRQVDAADGGAALRAAAAAVRDFRWVVFTSVNAVDRFVAQLRDARAFGSASVAAVGGATADALRAEGIEPDLVPAEHSARGLVEVFPPAPEGGGRVLFPAADIAPDTIDSGLGHVGWDVQRVEAYRTVAAAAPEPEVLARVAGADALVLTATSSVHALVALRNPDRSAVPVPAHVVCIGPTTAAAARGAGMTGVHEAWGASADGIVAELSDHFGHAGPAAAPEPGAADAS
ncbi:MAG TPA: uroporphyrinogen-III C-methyltransferase [Acidimicrobiales bacterium]|jgi:uroporphyrinogen III methyltransferase/synthase|nr:uroporphyrinogen-III C-methyltransferase [Acidimicrobiales bacterium]